MDVVGDTSHCQRYHAILARDTAEIGVSPLLHFVPYQRLASSSTEHDVNQTAHKAVRHKVSAVPAGTLPFWNLTQHWVRRRSAGVPDAPDVGVAGWRAAPCWATVMRPFGTVSRPEKSSAKCRNLKPWLSGVPVAHVFSRSGGA
jgi:hypothetical protein